MRTEKVANTGLDSEVEMPRAWVSVLYFQFVHPAGVCFPALPCAGSSAQPCVSVPAQLLQAVPAL